MVKNSTPKNLDFDIKSLFSFLIVMLSIAFSTQGGIVITVINHNDNGAGSLRQAVTSSSDGDTIRFSSTLNGDSIVLTSGQIVLNKNITIKGPGANRLIISGNNNSRIFEIPWTNTVEISGLTFRNGKAIGSYPNARGGAIYCTGTLTLINDEFYYNRADSFGGALYLELGYCDISGTTFWANRSAHQGGAVVNIAGLINMVNTTISGNFATERGGGIYNQSITPITAKTTLTNCTIVYNKSGTEGGGIACTFLVYTDTSRIEMVSTIVGMNDAGTYAEDIFRDLSSRAEIKSFGNNLVSIEDSSHISAQSGDILGNKISIADPLVSTLGYYGGPTRTHKLLCNSPCFNAGKFGSTVATDQRGEPRPFGGVVDMGAYEAQIDISLPSVYLGADIDTCYGTSLNFTAGTSSDSVNWYRSNGTLLWSNNMNFTFVTANADTLVAEVFTPARCPGYDTINIRYVDVILPKIQNCPAAINTLYDNTYCRKKVAWTPPTASDNCGIKSFTSNYSSGDSFVVGTTDVVYTAKDQAGNTATCTFKIIVTDNDPPVISCPSNIVVNKDPSSCTKIVNYTPPEGVDICPGVTTTRIAGLGPGSAFPVGVTEEKYVVTDASGNKDTCSFTISVVDNDFPAIKCPNDTQVNNIAGLCEALVNYIAPVGTDNCPGATTSLQSGLGTGKSFPAGINTEVWAVTDAYGNKSTCSFKITVKDSEKPVITCPANIETCDTVISFTEPVGTDNCSGSTTQRTGGLPSGSVFPLGTTNEIYKVTDGEGNTDICTFAVVVHSFPVVDAGKDTTLFYGDQIELNPQTSGATSFLWSPGNYLSDSTIENPVAEPDTNITYRLTVKNDYNCESSDSINIRIVFELFIPTGFTPDSDGKNDTWYIKGIKRFPDCVVEVRNIWGNVVFSKKGYDGDWDGTFNGNVLPTATYYYLIDLKDGHESLKGTLTIIHKN